MTQELLYDKRGDIGWITFNRPQARNSLTFNMYERLAEICATAGEPDAYERAWRAATRRYALLQTADWSSPPKTGRVCAWKRFKRRWSDSHPER